jgi:hypothetical protein
MHPGVGVVVDRGQELGLGAAEEEGGNELVFPVLPVGEELADERRAILVSQAMPGIDERDLLSKKPPQALEIAGEMPLFGIDDHGGDGGQEITGHEGPVARIAEGQVPLHVTGGVEHPELPGA